MPGAHSVRAVAAALALAAVAAVVAGCAGGPCPGGRPAPVRPRPRVQRSPAGFFTMAARFRERKHTVVIAKLPGNDNVVNAKVIRDIVAARGWTKVAIVGHSMGGLSGRQYIRFDGGRKWRPCTSRSGSAEGPADRVLLRPEEGGQMCPDLVFLTKLNAGDETPGTTKWTSVYSTTDGLVPTSASRLVDGACDVKVSGPDHSQLLPTLRSSGSSLGRSTGSPARHRRSVTAGRRALGARRPRHAGRMTAVRASASGPHRSRRRHAAQPGSRTPRRRHRPRRRHADRQRFPHLLAQPPGRRRAGPARSRASTRPTSRCGSPPR